MTKDIKLPCILAGYGLFASEGPKGLKVEVIATGLSQNADSGDSGAGGPGVDT